MVVPAVCGLVATSTYTYHVQWKQQVSYPSTFRGTSLVNNALTLTLKAKQEVSEVISDVSISSTSFWWSKIFWGKSTNPNVTDPSQLNFLQSCPLGYP